MHASQIKTVLELMERVDNRADYVDLRKIVNRYLDGIGKEFQPKKQPLWKFDTSFSSEMRATGMVLNDFLCLTYGNKPYPINGTQGYKIQLIKKLRELGPQKEGWEQGTTTSTLGLKECKEFIEKYFIKWC